MTIYNYIIESAQRSGTGVARFAQMLKRAIPEIVEVAGIPDLANEDLVICDNHRGLDVLERIKTIVVHHGCALRHFDRDKTWQSGLNLAMADDQLKMFMLPNRKYIAPSRWVADAFKQESGLGTYYQPVVIPHWVDSIPSLPKPGRPLIIGDWRDNNKGANAWKKLASENPQWDFKPLNFKTEAEKQNQYGEASLYLCLSLSEGGSYSMCDAEAARIPIVSTDTGNYLEFSDCEIILWQDRENLKIVADAIDRKLSTGRKSCFYDTYSFEDWQKAWLNVIQ